MATPPRSARDFADATTSPPFRRDRRPLQLPLSPAFEKPSAQLGPLTGERLRIAADHADYERRGRRRRRTPGSRNFIYGSTDG